MASSVSTSSSSPELKQSKLVVVRSSDGVLFSILERVVVMMNSLRHVVEHPGLAAAAGRVIPLENVDLKNLILVLKYCDHHSRLQDPPVSPRKNAEMMKKFDYEFFNDIKPQDLLPLLRAANYLQVPALSHLCEFHIRNHLTKNAQQPSSSSSSSPYP